MKKALINLLKSFDKKLVIRTLLSEKTHLSQYLYSDEFDSNGNPRDFLFQNTYSYEYIKDIVNSFDSTINLEFIRDKFDTKVIQKEGDDWRNKQGFATTSISNDLQIAGDKVFRWCWIVCSKSS